MTFAKSASQDRRSGDWVQDGESPEYRSLHRMNLALPMPLHDRLREVAKVSGALSVTEVVKSAIKLYVAAIYAGRRGEVLIFRRKDGTGIERIVDVEAGIF